MMKYDMYEGVKLKDAKIPKDKDVYPHPESGINITMHQLAKENLPEDHVLFGNMTVADLKKVLHSATSYIDYAMFELGELTND